MYLDTCGLWFVNGNPCFDVFSKDSEAQSSVFSEVICNKRVQPSTHLVENQWKIPVVQRY